MLMLQLFGLQMLMKSPLGTNSSLDHFAPTYGSNAYFFYEKFMLEVQVPEAIPSA